MHTGIPLPLLSFPPILLPSLPLPYPLLPLPSSLLLYLSLQIYSQTHDDHFQLIVVDYHSEDLNVEEELKKSSLKK